MKNRKKKEERDWSDPIVDEIHALRERHAREFDYDIEAMVKDLIRRQEQSDRELVSFPPKRIDKKDKRGAA